MTYEVVMIDEIRQTADFLSSHIKEIPDIGLITGTGLGLLTDQISVDLRLPYEDIPNFPRSTIEGHQGQLVSGSLAGKNIIAMEGRFHLYEGYTPKDINFPVRVFSKLGINNLFISSAAGGLNPQFERGDLMLVTDHINLTGTNPLMGPNLDVFGPRFPDMSTAYDPDLIALGKKLAVELRIPLKQGVYVGLAGPSLETPAETRFLKMIGADAVGMSTVLEVITAAHCNLKIMAIVVITNMNLPDCMEKTSIEDVIATAQNSGTTLSRLWKNIIKNL